MGNFAEKDGDVAGKDGEWFREGYEMWQRRMGDVAEKDGDVAEKDTKCGREG